MNRFSLIGRLVKKPELRYTKTNKAVVEVTIATNEKESQFIPITFFKKQAENLHKYCDKGSLIAVSGTIKNHNWEDKDNNKHYGYTFMGQNVEFLSTKSNYTENKENALNDPKNESSMDEKVFEEFGNDTTFEISEDEFPF